MNKIKFTLSLFTFIFLSLHIVAQDDQPPVKREEIDVVKPYEPALAEAVKIKFSPELPAAKDTLPIDLSYSTPGRFLDLRYEAPALRPLAISPEEPEKLQNFRIKAGYGTQSTSIGEIIYNTGRNGNFAFGAQAKHISSKGKLKHQKYSDNSAKVFGSYFFDKFSWRNELNYQREVVHFYGFNFTPDFPSVSEDNVKQRFNRFRFSSGVKNLRQNKSNIDYKADVFFKYITNIWGEAQNQVGLNGSLNKAFSSGDKAGANLEVDYINYTSPGLDKEDTLWNNFLVEEGAYPVISLNPYLILSKINLKIGITGAIDKDKIYLFPDVRFSPSLINEKLSFYIGANGGITVNNLYSVAEENPFIHQLLNYKNTKSLNLFGGLKGNVIQDFTYDLSYTLSAQEDIPLFVNNIGNLDFFDVIYDDAEVHNVQLSVLYQRLEKIRFHFTGNFYNYNLTQELHAWHKPTLRGDLFASYNLGDKILFTTNLYAQNSTFAKLPDDEVRELRGMVDINLSINYKYSKNISIFVEGNNLAAVKHQRWHRYPSYGLQATGGLIIKL